MVVIKATKGQGLVEFTLVLVILLLVGFGIFDLGRVFHSLITITNASREGARYLSIHPSDNMTGFSGTINAAVNEAQGSSLNLLPSQVSVTLCIDHDPMPGCDSGFPVRVTVTYKVDFFMEQLFPSFINLIRSTEMIVP